MYEIKPFKRIPIRRHEPLNMGRFVSYFETFSRTLYLNYISLFNNCYHLYKV